jgi:pantoate--beta-alanine ligase
VNDGLALASRNNYLSATERVEAPRLYRTLRAIADEIAEGRTDYANLESSGRADLAKHGWKVDYLAVRHGLGLRVPHPEGLDHPHLLIVLGAATLGSTRLIQCGRQEGRRVELAAAGKAACVDPRKKPGRPGFSLDRQLCR